MKVKHIAKITSCCILYFTSLMIIFTTMLGIHRNRTGVIGLSFPKYIFLFSSCYLVSVADLLLASTIQNMKLKPLKIILFVHAIGGVLYATTFILLRVLHIY